MTHGSGYVKGCQCERCEAARARAREYRHPDPQRRRAYRTAKQREYDAKRLAEVLESGMKPCTNPKPTSHEPRAVKPLDQFHPKPGTKTGLDSHCKDCKNEARKARYSLRLEREHARANGYYQDKGKARYREIRQHAIEIYGGQCEGCGDTHDLEFDHVNGDGGEHRKVEGADAMIRRIARTGQRITDYELRLLCADCHDLVTNGLSRDRLRLLLAHSRGWPSQAVLAILPGWAASEPGQGVA